MRNHPANSGARVGSYGAALISALEAGGEALFNAPDVLSLGQREKRVTTRNGERVYTLEGWQYQPADGAPLAFYVLAGGAGSARTVLDSNGEPIAHAERKGRGLSPEFREWIARAVNADRATDRRTDAERAADRIASGSAI